MTYNEETLFLLHELEKFGLSRYDAEKELRYSPNYIGQLLSKETNEKVNAALKMLLRIKVLEQELGYSAEIPKPRNKEDDFKEIVAILKDIHASLNETNANLAEVKHTDVLNQCLLKTSILQSAKLEAAVTGKDQGAIVEGLNKATATTFDDIHNTHYRKNKAHSVGA